MARVYNAQSYSKRKTVICIRTYARKTAFMLNCMRKAFFWTIVCKKKNVLFFGLVRSSSLAGAFVSLGRTKTLKQHKCGVHSITICRLKNMFYEALRGQTKLGT